jgi:L-asparaginase
MNKNQDLASQKDAFLAPLIVLLATGGTIAGTAASSSDATGYVAGQLSAQQLLSAVPSLAGRARFEVQQVCNIDSKDMSPAIWCDLAQRAAAALARADVAACLITHGTDTLEETATFLQLVHASSKPLVLTAAMRPATHSHADGPGNLSDAVTVALNAGAYGQGVLCVLAGQAHAARDIRKVQTLALAAFTSGDLAPLATVNGSAVHWQRSAEQTAPVPIPPWQTSPTSTPRVDIVMSYAGADGCALDACVAAGARGIVVAGTGNGTVTQALQAAMDSAVAAGVRVVLASRVTAGPVTPRAEVEVSGDLTAAKARVRLMVELAALRAA